jgi:hypothetical protein
VGNVAPLVHRLGLIGELRRDDVLGPDEWWAHDLAAHLKMPQCKLYYWVRQGWVHARRTESGRYWVFWADRSELARLHKLKAQTNSYISKRNPSLVIPRARKK